MATMAENKERNTEGQVYEIGFHVMPTVPESDVPAIVSKIKSLIEEEEGKVIKEEAPKLQALSYEVSKMIDSKSQKFNKAYFGWIKFEANGSLVTRIKESFQNIPEILRFILAKTVREDTIFHPKSPRSKKENGETPIKYTAGIKEISDAEIDKSIEQLVLN